MRDDTYVGGRRKETSPKGLIMVIGVALALVVAFVLGQRSPIEPDDLPDGAPVGLAPPTDVTFAVSDIDTDTDQARVQIEMLRQDNQGLREQIEDLESLLGGSGDSESLLKGQLTSSREDVERYRKGLDKCVTELNVLQRAPQSQQREPSKSRPRAPRAESNPNVFVRQPYMVVSGLAAEIEGNVHNTESETVSGFVYVELLKDGKVVDTKRVSLRLPARTVVDYSTRFANIAGASFGTYTVRAEWSSQ